MVPSFESSLHLIRTCIQRWKNRLQSEVLSWWCIIQLLLQNTRWRLKYKAYDSCCCFYLLILVWFLHADMHILEEACQEYLPFLRFGTSEQVHGRSHEQDFLAHSEQNWHTSSFWLCHHLPFSGHKKMKMGIKDTWRINTVRSCEKSIDCHADRKSVV